MVDEWNQKILRADRILYKNEIQFLLIKDAYLFH